MNVSRPSFILLASLVAVSGPAAAQCEVTQLVGSDTVSFDRFGHTVAVSDDLAIIGAVNHEHGVDDGGGAYAFELTPGGWSEVAELVPSDSQEGDAFGRAVALSGDRALVSAPFDDDGGLDSGSVYVFLRTPAGWIQEAKLIASDAAGNDGFGVSVSLSGDRALVGAYRFSDFGGVFGAAYVFERTALGWSEVAKLTASDAAADDQFGGTVSISSEHAIVGAAGSKLAQFFGAAYVFERTALGWDEVDKLTASDAAPWTYFGTDVAISGETALISSPSYTGQVLGSGAVYVFERSVAGWQETDILVASDAEIGDSLADSIALSGDKALLGVQNHDAAGINSGAVYVFERTVAGWVETAELVPSDAMPGDRFGNTVALFGNTVLVGAASRDPAGGGFDSGVAYVFSLGIGASYCISVPNSTGFPASLSTEGCGSVAANDLVLLAEPVPNQPGVFYYGLDPTQVPFGNGFRCVGGTVYRLDVEWAVGNVLSHALDVTDPPSVAGQITAGSTWNFQAWFRDPAAGGAFFNLSDGQSVTFTL